VQIVRVRRWTNHENKLTNAVQPTPIQQTSKKVEEAKKAGTKLHQQKCWKNHRKRNKKPRRIREEKRDKTQNILNLPQLIRDQALGKTSGNR